MGMGSVKESSRVKEAEKKERAARYRLQAALRSILVTPRGFEPLLQG